MRCASLLPNDPYQEGSLPHTATLGTTPLRGNRRQQSASCQSSCRQRGGSFAREEGQRFWPQTRAPAGGGSDDEAKFTSAGDDAIMGRPP